MDKETAREYVKGLVNPDTPLGVLFTRYAMELDETTATGTDRMVTDQELVAMVNRRTGSRINASDLAANGAGYLASTENGRRSLRAIKGYMERRGYLPAGRRPVTQRSSH